ncbi:hypothetical protein OS493_040472, partial [Desmophyllum pertusum]
SDDQHSDDQHSDDQHSDDQDGNDQEVPTDNVYRISSPPPILSSQSHCDMEIATFSMA